MTPIKLFIADADPAHIRRVRAVVSRREDMVVSGSATDGCQALRALRDAAPDLLLTDIQLPGLDGLLLLRDLTDAGRCPPFIVCTQFYSGMSVDMAVRLGACYVLYKPLDYERLPQLIRMCLDSLHPVKRLPSHPLDEVSLARVHAARSQLRALGIPAQLTGALYLIEAMTLLFDDRAALMRNLSKGLYAEVARHTQTTPARVERSMRTAITAGYLRGSMAQHFQCRPSNREFIEYLFRQLCEAEAEATRLPPTRPISSRLSDRSRPVSF